MTGPRSDSRAVSPPVSPNGLAEFCRKHGIRRLDRFAPPPDADAAEDLVLVASFETSRTPGLLGLGRLEDGLSDLWGRRVALVSRFGMERNPLPFRRAVPPGAPENLHAH